MIGCGGVTEVKSGPGFQKARDSELAGVTCRTPAAAEDYARRHGVPRVFQNADAMIRSTDIDALYVATPPGSHLEYALKICAAGKPAYIEKPMARNAEEGRLMVEAFGRSGLPLFVAYYRRALPRFIKVKQLLDGGALGRIESVRYRYTSPAGREADPSNLPWRLKAELSGGGLFMDIGCHTLDVFDFLFGPLQAVSGRAENRGARYDVEDTVRMQFRLASGATGEAAWDFGAEEHVDLIEIAGAEARVTLATFGDTPVRLESAAGQQTFVLPNPPHIQQPLIQTIVDELHGRGKCPSTGESALRTTAVMDKVLESYYGSRRSAFWSHPHAWAGRARR
jgi:predicted dehydrogenase